MGGEEPSDLLLARDVLDSQIVDIEGRRIARVGDVELARETDELRCVAVDTGLGAIARRFGLRRLAERLSSGSVAWSDMHLTADPGHQLQLESPAAGIHRLTPEELMHLVGRLSVEHAGGGAPGGAGARRGGRAQRGPARVRREAPPGAEGRQGGRSSWPICRSTTRRPRCGRSRPRTAGVARAARTPSGPAASRQLLEHAEGTAGSLMTPDAQTAAVGEPIASVRERLAADPPRARRPADCRPGSTSGDTRTACSPASDGARGRRRAGRGARPCAPTRRSTR